MESTTPDELQSTAQDKMLAMTSAVHDAALTTVGNLTPRRDDKALENTSTMQETTIAELHPTSYDKILEARVYRKWVAVSYQKNGTKKETGFCCILIDREGNAIRCNMNIRDVDFFKPKIKVGSVYKISEFMCEPTTPYQQTIDNKTSIRFGKITKFELSTATDIPHHYFNFVSYNQLQSRIPREGASGQMEYPILTDYIGCLGSVGKIRKKGGPNEDQTIYRKVDIENLNGNIVEFTMWDKMAEEFGMATLETMEQPVIIAVSSCRVSKYIDYQLAATSATYFYLNPRIPEADQSRAQYKARHTVTPPLRICKTPFEDIEKEKFRNRFPLKTLLKQSPETYKGVKFTTEATITGIDIKKHWFYISCNECATKVKVDDGIYRCLNHGRQAQPCYRYNFKAFITDPSATAAVTFFTPAADDVTGYRCSELIAKHKTPDPQEIPPEIFAVEGQKNVFQIHFNTTSTTPSFILDQVFNKKKKDEGLSITIETNTRTPPPILAITGTQDSEGKTPTEASTKTVKRPVFEDELTMIETSTGTPPPTLPITDAQDSEGKTPVQASTKTVKRPLFQDEPSDSKKQKGTTSLAKKINTPTVARKNNK